MLLACALLCGTSTKADNWMAQIGGAGPDVVFDLVETPDRRLCAAGTFANTVQFGEEPEQVTLRAANEQDVYLACFTHDGHLAMAVRFGGDISDQPRAIAALPNGDVVITGHFLHDFGVGGARSLSASGGTDIFLMRINPAGEEVWSRRFGGSFADSGSSLAIAPNGDILLAGNFQEAMAYEVGDETRSIVSKGGRDAFLLRLTSDGAVRWAQRFGGDGRDEANRVATDKHDNVYIAGTFENYAATGEGNGELVAREAADTFLISFDAAGRLNWSRQLAGSGREYLSGLEVDAQGELYASGNFSGDIKLPDGISLHSQGGTDIFLVKFDTDGQQRWARRIGGPENDESFDLAVTDANTLLVSGHFHGEIRIPGNGNTIVLPPPADGNADGFLLMFDTVGAFREAITAAGDGVQTIYTIAALSGGGVASAGFFNNDVTVQIDGLRKLVKRGATDVFLLRAEAGNYQTSVGDVVHNILYTPAAVTQP